MPSLEELLHDPNHQQRVEKIARRYTRKTSISWEDAAQAGILKVVEAVQAGKFPGGEKFYNWTIVVARNGIIDFIKHSSQRSWQSLDQNLPGTNFLLLETIRDEFDAWDTLVRTDLVHKAIAAIIELDQRYPDNGYLKLWNGRVQGKTLEELAPELDLKSQGAVSKRWKKLTEHVAQELGLLPSQRERSNEQW
jgi:RNA polymerase sporulation-specific sigma factor